MSDSRIPPARSFEFFSRAGTVVDVKLITDKNTRRSRGLAYIEYATMVRPHGARMGARVLALWWLEG